MGSELPELRELTASALRCLASFELLTSKLYERLARKTSDGSASLVFKWLSIESNSHAALLGMLASPLGVKEEDCAKFVGLPWRIVDELMRETEPDEHLGDEALAGILRRLQSVEGLAAEEVYSRIAINLIRELMPTISADAEIVDTILWEISEEEKYHEKLLLAVARVLERKAKAGSSTPQVG